VEARAAAGVCICDFNATSPQNTAQVSIKGEGMVESNHFGITSGLLLYSLSHLSDNIEVYNNSRAAIS
jgi:hypothetical protein